MPPQSAYNPAQPNGSGRRPLGDRVIYLFRVYRKREAIQFGPLGDGFLDDVRRVIRSGRDLIHDAQEFLSPLNSPLTGFILEKEFRFTLLLEGFEETPEARTSFTYTNDTFYIDKPFRNAKGITRFRIRGRTYWTPVLVNGVPVDGDAALKEFKELVDDYLYPREGSPADRLFYWYNLNAPLSGEDQFGEFEWLIEPSGAGVRTLQSAQKPFIRFFLFEFRGLQSNRDRAKAEDGFLAGLMSRGLLQRLLDAIGLGFLLELIDSVFGAVDDFLGLLGDIENLITQVNDYIQGAVDFIRASFAKIRALITAIESIIGRVQDGIDLLRSIPDVVSAEVDALREQLRIGWPGLEGESENGIILCNEANKIRDFLLALAAQPQSFVSPVQQSSALTRTLALRVAPGATIEKIAQDAHVDVATLIKINGLRYPFVESRPRPERQIEFAAAALSEAEARRRSADDQLTEQTAISLPDEDSDPEKRQIRLAPFRQAVTNAAAVVAEAAALVSEWQTAAAPTKDGVLYAGDLIRIPVERPQALPSIIGVDGNQILASAGVNEEERIFGIDLLLDVNGNLVWDLDRQDLALARGLDNIHATQLRYVRLPMGALRFAPALGNFAYEDLGKWQGEGTNRLLAYSLWKTLSQDPRIVSIDDLRAEMEAGRAFVVYRATLINGEAVPDLRLPIAA